MFYGATCGQYDSICVAWSCDGIPKDTSLDLLRKPPAIKECNVNDAPPFTIGEPDSRPSMGNPSLNYLNDNSCTCTVIKLL